VFPESCVSGSSCPHGRQTVFVDPGPIVQVHPLGHRLAQLQRGIRQDQALLAGGDDLTYPLADLLWLTMLQLDELDVADQGQAVTDSTPLSRRSAAPPSRPCATLHHCLMSLRWTSDAR
jgi:hypothetical protein